MMNCPDKEGYWLNETLNEVIEVYRLDPVDGVLCVWGPDVGMTYSFVADTQSCWDTDEWQGHIPVNVFDNVGPWKFLRRNI